MDWEGIIGNGIRATFGPEAAVFALLAIGLNVHYGFTGLLNFGQVGFMLVGAYGMAVSTVTWGWSIWIGMAVGLSGAVLLALLMGIPTLRLRADYFAITTIAAAEILRLVVRSNPAADITGGPLGLQNVARGFPNPIARGRYGFNVIQYTHTQLWAMIIAWILVILATVLVALLMRSPWGRIIKSIREDEDAARSLGKNVFGYKLQSLVLGGVLGGVGGIMFALASTNANADAFQPQITFFAYTALILGGAASRIGPIVGAMIFFFILSGSQSFLREAGSNDLLPSVFTSAGGIGATANVLIGLLLMGLIIFRPQGIFGNRQEIELGD